MDEPADGDARLRAIKNLQLPSPSESGPGSTATSADPLHRGEIPPPSASMSKSDDDPPLGAEQSLDPTTIDYQSLPSPPDYGLDLVDDFFGRNVEIAYDLSCLVQTLREQKYGQEIATAYRRGFTPSPVRQEYADRMETLRILHELPSDDEDIDIDEYVSIRKAENKVGSTASKWRSATNSPVGDDDFPGQQEGPESITNDKQNSEQSKSHSLHSQYQPPGPNRDYPSQKQTRTSASPSCDDPVSCMQNIAAACLAPNPTVTLKRRRQSEDPVHCTPHCESPERTPKRVRRLLVP
ncbi:hypothetical protein FQN53_007300 [Emmonsiellopsis sp. PD_33]|nr:hypothetical protein FQN53_007300 [Emmonsiellopsis sp. PD_33]